MIRVWNKLVTMTRGWLWNNIAEKTHWTFGTVMLRWLGWGVEGWMIYDIKVATGCFWYRLPGGEMQQWICCIDLAALRR